MNRTLEEAIYAMLSDPEFDPTDYAADALMKFFKENYAGILKENPEVCKYFIETPEAKSAVADKIDITDKKLVRKFLAIYSKDDWNNSQPLVKITSRLEPEMLVEIIADLTDDQLGVLVRYGTHHEDYYYAKAIIDRIFPKMHSIKEMTTILVNNMHHDEEAYEHLIGVLDKIPDDIRTDWVYRPIVVQIRSQEWLGAISAIAKKLATTKHKKDAFYKVLKKTRQHLLMCPNCGESMKSRPGLTLHRKKCDPDNNYPVPAVVLADKGWKSII